MDFSADCLGVGRVDYFCVLSVGTVEEEGAVTAGMIKVRNIGKNGIGGLKGSVSCFMGIKDIRSGGMENFREFVIKSWNILKEL